MRETVLLTGYAGFIGSQLLRDLIKEGYFVVGIDNFSEGSSKDNFAGLEKDFLPLTFDIADPNIGEMLVEKGVSKIDYLINCGAESVAENMLLPIKRFGEISYISFLELFKDCSKNSVVEKQDESIQLEVVNLTNKNIQAIGYYAGMGQFLPINQISRHYYKGKMIRLKQKFGEVVVTPNHSIYSADGKVVSPKENLDLLPMRKLNWSQQKKVVSCIIRIKSQVSNNWIFYKNKPDIKFKKNLEGDDFKAFIRIIGAYVSEGSASYNRANGSYQVMIANQDKETLSQLKNDLESISTCKWEIVPNTHTYQLQTSSKLIYDIFRKYFGFNSGSKKLPNFVFCLDEENKELLWKFLCWGDGTRYTCKKGTTFKYTSTSYLLQCQIGLLLTIMKKDYSVYIRDHKNNENWNVAYDLKEVFSYQPDQGINILEEIDYEGWVYDLSIEKTNNFCVGVGNIVVHNTHVDRSWEQVNKFIDSNIKGPINLATLALNPNLGVKKFVHVSTDEVFADSEQPFHEGSLITPQNAYATSKASAEMFLKNYHRAFGLPLIITNGANTYGERQLEEKIIPLTIKRIVTGKKVPLYKTQAQRMWLHVENHSSGIIQAMQNGKIGEKYCLAPDHINELYTEELVRKICEILNEDFDKVVEYVEDRPNYDLRYFMENDKAVNELGWLPYKNILEELPAVVEYYKKKFLNE